MSITLDPFSGHAVEESMQGFLQERHALVEKAHEAAHIQVIISKTRPEPL